MGSHLLKLHCENRYQLAMKLFLLIWFVFSIASTSFACTWTRGNSCYNLVETGFTFWEGETYCNVMFNGHLLAINSMQEDDFIRARLLDLHYTSNVWWIGLAKAEGKWKWTSGEAVSYSNWANGQPSVEDVGAIRILVPGDSWLEWDDLNSTIKYSIICESNALN